MRSRGYWRGRSALAPDHHQIHQRGPRALPHRRSAGLVLRLQPRLARSVNPARLHEPLVHWVSPLVGRACQPSQDQDRTRKPQLSTRTSALDRQLFAALSADPAAVASHVLRARQTSLAAALGSKSKAQLSLSSPAAVAAHSLVSQRAAADSQEVVVAAHHAEDRTQGRSARMMEEMVVTGRGCVEDLPARRTCGASDGLLYDALFCGEGLAGMAL